MHDTIAALRASIQHLQWYNNRWISGNLHFLQKTGQDQGTFNEISTMQFHVIRAPLARFMGLVSLIESGRPGNGDVLSHIMTPARELDEVIRDIAARAEQM